MTRDELRTEILRDLDAVLNNRLISHHITDTQRKILLASRQLWANDNAALDTLLSVVNSMG